MTTVEFNPVSMLDRIKNAKSSDELRSLAIEGNGYAYATEKTRRRWKAASRARKAELRKTGGKKGDRCLP